MVQRDRQGQRECVMAVQHTRDEWEAINKARWEGINRNIAATTKGARQAAAMQRLQTFHGYTPQQAQAAAKPGHNIKKKRDESYYIEPSSVCIESIEYDAKAKTATVTFIRGGSRVYDYGVSRADARALKSAAKAGQAGEAVNDILLD